MAEKSVADTIRWWIEMMVYDVPIAGSVERVRDVYIPLMEKEIRGQIWYELEACGDEWCEKAKCLLQID